MPESGTTFPGRQISEYILSASDLNSHSQSYRITSSIGAVLIIAFGIYLSLIQFMNSEWLTRAGCVVVMLGIWSGVGGILQERLLVSRTKRRRRNAITAARARLSEEMKDADQTEKELTEINEAFDNQMEEATQNLRLSIGALEVSLLLSGTFLWGFGDLLVG